MNRAERRAKPKTVGNLILRVEPKPDFKLVAHDIVQKSTSPFTDENWLADCIANELKHTWDLATRTEEERIKELCIKQGRMDMFGRWRDK